MAKNIDTLSVAPYFRDIEKILIKHIDKAQKELLIAVAWFTNVTIYEHIISALDRGVKVMLITLYDQINVDGGLDFQEFVDAGGEFYLSSTNNAIMHNKYCVIDELYTLTGSYNFTYFAEHVNYENLIKISSKKLAKMYADDFNCLLKVMDKVSNYHEYKKHKSYPRDTFSAKRFNITDHYQKYCSEIEESYKEFQKCQTEIKDKFIIRDPVYKMWQKDYLVEQIIYRDGELIIRFSTKTDCGCFLCSPKTLYVWKLRSVPESKVYESYKITNVRVNDTLVLKTAKVRHIYHFSDKVNDKVSLENHPTDNQGNLVDAVGKPYIIETISVPDKFTLSCDIHFKIDVLENSIYSLYEGDESCKTLNNYWHALNINVDLNQENIE